MKQWTMKQWTMKQWTMKQWTMQQRTMKQRSTLRPNALRSSPAIRRRQFAVGKFAQPAACGLSHRKPLIQSKASSHPEVTVSGVFVRSPLVAAARSVLSTSRWRHLADGTFSGSTAFCNLFSTI
jgi:hypothetical protein